MKEYIIFFSLIILSFLWCQVVPKRIKDAVVPWMFAWVIYNVCCAAFYVGALHALLAISNYSAVIIMCDGFGYGKRGKNGVWIALLIFWGYLTISPVWGCYTLKGMFFWLNALCTSLCCGYYVARWVINTERGLCKLLFAMICVTTVIMILYSSHGALAQVEEGIGRAGFDSDTLDVDVKSNVNYTALVMHCIMPFLVVALLRPPRMKWDKMMRFGALILMMLVGLVLIRTGSRNGVVGALPALWYFLFSTTSRVKRRKRILMLIIVTILFIPLMLKMMSGAESIRAFDFENKELADHAVGAEKWTTGRMSMWVNEVGRMDLMQKIFGRGFERFDLVRGKVNAGNAHCMYMTIFYHSGMLGILLFLIFLFNVLSCGLKMGDRGRMGLLFLGTWLMTGIGESWGMGGGAIAIIGGFGIGLLTHGPVGNTEFWEHIQYKRRHWC